MNEMEISDQHAVHKSHFSVSSASRREEGERFSLGPLFCRLYGFVKLRIIRAIIWRLLEKMEHGQMYSLSLREIMGKYHGVEVGLYTEGAPFVPWAFPAGTKIGRYSTFYSTIRAFNANHPMNLKLTHALFYNPALGLVQEEPPHPSSS